MSTIRIVERAFSAVGLLLLLLGLLATPADAAGQYTPALQPSPRPPWYTTLTPQAANATPVSASSVGPPASASVSAPAPVLPSTGNSWHHRWLLGLGLGCCVVGLTFTVLGYLGVEAAPPTEKMEDWPSERLYWSDD
jgi:hypothetical protein